MSTIVTPAEAEAESRAIVQERVAAVRAKDAARLVAHHAADVVSYDLLEPLQQRGQQWFDGYDGPMDDEIVGLQVVAAFDVAFCYGVHHVSGTTRDGRKIDMHWRATQGFQLAHDHERAGSSRSNEHEEEVSLRRELSRRAASRRSGCAWR